MMPTSTSKFDQVRDAGNIPREAWSTFHPATIALAAHNEGIQPEHTEELNKLRSWLQTKLGDEREVGGLIHSVEFELRQLPWTSKWSVTFRGPNVWVAWSTGLEPIGALTPEALVSIVERVWHVDVLSDCIVAKVQWDMQAENGLADPGEIARAAEIAGFDSGDDPELMEWLERRFDHAANFLEIVASVSSRLGRTVRPR